jgi:hypothetical protein
MVPERERRSGQGAAFKFEVLSTTEHTPSAARVQRLAEGR